MNVYTYHKMVVYCLLLYAVMCFAEPECATIKINANNFKSNDQIIQLIHLYNNAIVSFHFNICTARITIFRRYF
jgi:hypothetical protein